MHAELVAKVDPVLERDEWLEYRRDGIGGSDASAVAGLNGYKSAYSLWVEKTQPDVVFAEVGEAAVWGHRFEPHVADEYMDRHHPIAVWEPEGLYRHPEHSFMLATPDRWVSVTEDRPEWLLEIKCSGYFPSKDWADDIPHAALFQVHHYLTVTGLPFADLAVLVTGNEYRDHSVKGCDHLRVWANRELSDLMVASERAFWDLVQNLDPPPVDGSPATADALKRMFLEASNDQEVELPGLAGELLGKLASVKQAQKELAETREGYESQIKEWLGPNGVGTIDGEKVVTWKAPKPRRTLDTALMNRVHTDIVESCTITVPSSRRLLPKPKGNPTP